MSLRGIDIAESSLREETNAVPTYHSDSIRELGRYRSFLRLKAMGLVSRFQSKLEPSDVVQQTLLDAHRNLDQFRGTSGAEMAKWLSQMLTNNVADAARALTRKKRDIRREQPLQVDGDSAHIGAHRMDRCRTDDPQSVRCSLRAGTAFATGDSTTSSLATGSDYPASFARSIAERNS